MEYTYRRQVCSPQIEKTATKSIGTDDQRQISNTAANNFSPHNQYLKQVPQYEPLNQMLMRIPEAQRDRKVIEKMPSSHIGGGPFPRREIQNKHLQRQIISQNGEQTDKRVLQVKDTYKSSGQIIAPISPLSIRTSPSYHSNKAQSILRNTNDFQKGFSTKSNHLSINKLMEYLHQTPQLLSRTKISDSLNNSLDQIPVFKPDNRDAKSFMLSQDQEWQSRSRELRSKILRLPVQKLTDFYPAPSTSQYHSYFMETGKIQKLKQTKQYNIRQESTQELLEGDESDNSEMVSEEPPNQKFEIKFSIPNMQPMNLSPVTTQIQSGDVTRKRQSESRFAIQPQYRISISKSPNVRQMNKDLEAIRIDDYAKECPVQTEKEGKEKIAFWKNTPAQFFGDSTQKQHKKKKSLVQRGLSNSRQELSNQHRASKMSSPSSQSGDSASPLQHWGTTQDSRLSSNQIQKSKDSLVIAAEPIVQLTKRGNQDRNISRRITQSSHKLTSSFRNTATVVRMPTSDISMAETPPHNLVIEEDQMEPKLLEDGEGTNGKGIILLNSSSCIY